MSSSPSKIIERVAEAQTKVTLFNLKKVAGKLSSGTLNLSSSDAADVLAVTLQSMFRAPDLCHNKDMLCILDCVVGLVDFDVRVNWTILQHVIAELPHDYDMDAEDLWPLWERVRMGAESDDWAHPWKLLGRDCHGRLDALEWVHTNCSVAV